MSNCEGCKKDLGGMEYVEEDDKPYCVPCYEKTFANTCALCQKTIGLDSRDVAVKSDHYHDTCFVCTSCKTKLGGKQFIWKEKLMYCLKCQNIDEKKKCDICKKDFQKGEKRCTAGTNFYHDKCFVCSHCKESIGTKEFYTIDEKFVCDSCFKDKHAKNCRACNKVVNGGLTYKDFVYHPECFVCAKCKKTLGDEGFHSRADMPYCGDCFADAFMEKCAICTKPVTGKHMKYEDQSFHADCFNCSKCKKNIAGEGFYKKENQYFCEKCI